MCVSLLCSSFFFLSSSQWGMEQELPEEGWKFSLVTAEMQSPSLICGNVPDWRYRWDHLEVSRLCILSDTLCGLRPGVSCSRLRLLARPGSPRRCRYKKMAWRVGDWKYFPHNLFYEHVQVQCRVLIGLGSQRKILAIMERRIRVRFWWREPLTLSGITWVEQLDIMK